MPNKITALLFLFGLSSFGLVPNIDISLNHPEISAKDGEATVNLSNGKSFVFAGRDTGVSFWSNNITFPQNSLALSSVPLSLYSDSQYNDFATVTAFSNGEEYSIRIVKFLKDGMMKVKITYVGIIPEIKHFSFIIGIGILFYIIYKRFNER